MRDEDYYIQLKLQVDVLQKILNDLQPNNFDWRYSIHKEVCKLGHIIGEYYNDGDDGLMG
jgi:hypothetical protein